jgi:hypothetical protein
MMTFDNEPVTSGADVELALRYTSPASHIDRFFIPATDFNCKYTKYERGWFSTGGYAYSWHRDNTMIEYQTPVCQELDDLARRIQEANTWLSTYYREELGLSATPVGAADYEMDLSEIANAWEAGCAPDYNARTETENPTVEFPDNRRTAGGHFHFGHSLLCDDVFPGNGARFIRNLAVLVAAGSQFCTNEARDAMRKELYGGAFDYRATFYGVEWRTFSAHQISDWAHNQYEVDLMRTKVLAALSRTYARMDPSDQELDAAAFILDTRYTSGVRTAVAQLNRRLSQERAWNGHYLQG